MNWSWYIFFGWVWLGRRRAQPAVNGCSDVWLGRRRAQPAVNRCSDVWLGRGRAQLAVNRCSDIWLGRKTSQLAVGFRLGRGRAQLAVQPTSSVRRAVYLTPPFQLILSKKKQTATFLLPYIHWKHENTILDEKTSLPASSFFPS